MPLHLIIENETSLPDGGPLSYTLTGARGFDIGRNPYLDWTLPDPSLAVSGKHCEVRFRDGEYWLTDVSRNGTFVNQTAQRLQEPYRLRSGDRIFVGHYVIQARIDGEGAIAAHAVAPAAQASDPADPWGIGEAAAPPIPRRDLRPPAESRPVHGDFQDWRMDLPEIAALPPVPHAHVGSYAPPAFPEAAMDWAHGTPAYRPAPEPLPPIPEPRRRAAASPWAEPPAPLPPDPGPAPHRGPPPDHALPPDRGSPPEDGNPWGRPSIAVTTPRRTEAPADPVPPPQPHAGGADAFVARFAKGAGVPAEMFSWRDPGDLAEELGALTRLTAENLKQLLAGRAEAKRVTRASSQTMIQALDNNPLKFTPTVEDALQIMFGRPSSGYLPARRALEEGFRDLKEHQVKVYSAMQHALRLLLQDLDPEVVEAALGDDRGLSGFLGSRKARLWDVYATRWDALTSAHEEGMVDAFMVFFAECYDRGGKG
ncbi:hypothetical protein AFCDBAGC_3501 [Methylobacterium cerastii]|uniref:FHA domain-containing protein n=1 Tax=Methylobacterium cerastii TaxID=932741 RepID=A0ABQ4QK73_9HYPH|nr:type VI secretion system-associated FHA domain protein TagH [Methylobacterium cerastii]GJD45627.1 hypothetical protein AFCDBAGC_3501 [Methylobacterium cerastii]